MPGRCPCKEAECVFSYTEKAKETGLKTMKKRTGTFFGTMLALVLVVICAMGRPRALTAYAEENGSGVTAGGGMTWSSLKAALEAGGTVSLDNDVTRSANEFINIPSGVTATLDLNGHALDGGGSAYRYTYLISISEGGNLTVRDSGGSGAMQNVSGTGIMYICGPCTLESGTVSGSIDVADQGSFTMTGGTITDNNNGVYNSGSFTMTGGTVTGCSTGVDNVGSFTMTGGTITGNTCGVNTGSNNGSAVFEGGTITGNETGIKHIGKEHVTINGDPQVTGNTKDLDLSEGPWILVGDRLSEDASVGLWTDYFDREENRTRESVVFIVDWQTFRDIYNINLNDVFFSNRDDIIVQDAGSSAILVWTGDVHGSDFPPDDPKPPKNVHTHDFVWTIIKEATPDTDGEMAPVCRECGAVGEIVPLSGYGAFCLDTAKKIRYAAPGGEVKASTKKWISFSPIVWEALSERPDVTLVIEYMDAGEAYEVKVPAGTDVKTLMDENGYAGFLYLSGMFGRKAAGGEQPDMK